MCPCRLGETSVSMLLFRPEGIGARMIGRIDLEKMTMTWLKQEIRDLYVEANPTATGFRVAAVVMACAPLVGIVVLLLGS